MFPENNSLAIDFSETRVIWHHFSPIIVPEEFTLTEERYLLAALQTLSCGNTSVDNILKTQLLDYERRQEKALENEKSNKIRLQHYLISETLKKAKRLYSSTFGSLKKIDFTTPTEPDWVCQLVFQRLHSSIKACRFLIKYGYYFETYAIERQILEQLAFTYHVSLNKSYVDFLSPTSCIKYLKQIYPKAGEFYGLLSNKTHIDKTQIKEYYYDEETKIVLNSIDYSVWTLYHFLVLLDIYCITFEYCFKSYIDKGSFQFLTRTMKVKKNRPSIKLVNQYREEIISLEEKSYS